MRVAVSLGCGAHKWDCTCQVLLMVPVVVVQYDTYINQVWVDLLVFFFSYGVRTQRHELFVLTIIFCSDLNIIELLLASDPCFFASELWVGGNQQVSLDRFSSTSEWCPTKRLLLKWKLHISMWFLSYLLEVLYRWCQYFSLFVGGEKHV